MSLKSGTGFIPLLAVIYLHFRYLTQTKCPGTSELRVTFWGFISICRFEMLDFVFAKKENEDQKTKDPNLYYHFLKIIFWQYQLKDTLEVSFIRVTESFAGQTGGSRNQDS